MYQDEFSSYLTDNTRYSWHRVPRLYVDFKLKTSPMGHICVATPDAYPRQEPFCRFYMPKNNEHIYHPRLFVNDLLNSDRTLVNGLPWIKLDIDQAPKIKGVTSRIIRGNLVVVKYEVGLTGDIKMKKIGSVSNQTLGISRFHNISYNAKEEFFGLAHNVKADLDFEKMEVSVDGSVVGPLGSTSFKIKSDGSVEAELMPSGNVKHFELHGWLFEVHLGYKLTGKYEQTTNTPPPHETSWATTFEALGMGIAMGALIICTAGTAAIPEAIGASAITAASY